MSMERWNPFRDMDTMRQAMDRWFDDRWPGSMLSNMGQGTNVAVDVNETDNGYELTANIPGMRPEDIDITVNRDTVTLRGTSQQNTERKEGNYIYRERHSGSFHRTIRLPEPVNADQVEAELDHGVLRVTLPRLQQTPNRRVQVRPGTGSSQQMNVQSGQTSTMSGQSRMSGMGSPGGSATTGVTGTGPNLSATGTTGGGAMHSSPNYPTGSSSTGTGSTGTGSSGMRESGTAGGAMPRPSVLNTLGSTQMESLEQHIQSNDEQGFRRLAGSYGWDQGTVDQVWRYMSRHATPQEARRAFEGQGNQGQGQQPTNSL